ncbi:putative MFS-type transporter YbfB, partial [Clonorchis sinensis]
MRLGETNYNTTAADYGGFWYEHTRSKMLHFYVVFVVRQIEPPETRASATREVAFVQQLVYNPKGAEWPELLGKQLNPIGTVRVRGNMAPYIVDYMNSNNISVDKTSAVWLTSVGFSMQSIAMPLSAYIATKIGFRIVVICSCVLHSGSIALTYFAVGWGYWAVVLFYGIFTGIGFGAGYSVIIATASEWFPNRRGLVVGLVLGGFGAGALIFTPVQTGFINPANLKINTTTGSFTQPEILNRVPQAFLLLAGITATLQIIGLFLMQEKPQSAIENEQLGPEGQNVPYSENIEFDEEEKTTKRPNRYYVNWDRK